MGVNIAAVSALVVDAGSGTVLFEKQADEPRSIGSMTKLMTALVAVKNYSLEDVFVVPVDCTTIDSTKAWL